MSKPCQLRPSCRMHWVSGANSVGECIPGRDAAESLPTWRRRRRHRGSQAGSHQTARTPPVPPSAATHSGVLCATLHTRWSSIVGTDQVPRGVGRPFPSTARSRPTPPRRKEAFLLATSSLILTATPSVKDCSPTAPCSLPPLLLPHQERPPRADQHLPPRPPPPSPHGLSNMACA